ncbi:MAG: DUF4212 domain-containing protein [Planctomycetota bacterium]|jgi:putative solute:sodium symporter small subunit
MEAPENTGPVQGENHRRYWRACLKTIIILLSIWFVIGFVLPLFLVDQLNEIRIGGFKLGFWMAQQGGIIGFILLITVYSFIADRLDRQFRVGEEEEG